MAKWTAFPYDNADYVHDAATLKKHWARLHAGDAEPWPKDAAGQEAWALFHAGEFRKAVDAGLKAGGPGAALPLSSEQAHFQGIRVRRGRPGMTRIATLVAMAALTTVLPGCSAVQQLAGAFQTPRVESVRAYTPASVPDGAMAFSRRSSSGSATRGAGK